ncbi:PREDICTED: superoxide dismutase [Fe] 3, chloroplastic isoform X1 [Nicotiana attenuata]|uniref:superoxide dismutase [Fe] 3, chloroplastic isoform X1 n=1 Tax=Nicotiana attenuata TaxID=49451 RepID=UPI000904CEA7|nr:PREDICTED: superoxide dismutase [Fe] 3, chloroplastic isoform X1 [Nicotiana attenuata]
MSWSSCNSLCTSSSRQLLVTTDLSSQLNIPSRLSNVGLRQKKSLHGHHGVPKVFAYYGLKTPPYKLDALEPYMSQKMLEVHWGEHHRGYVEALNKQLEKNDILYGCTMEELIKVTYNNGNPLPEFSDAAQVWNHDFFWESMQPGGGDMPKLGLLQQIEKDFGSFTNFREKFTEAALTLFGSGWIWLVLKREEKRLAIVKTSNAVNPLVWNDIPLIGLDLWEHAYYLDYKVTDSSSLLLSTRRLFLMCPSLFPLFSQNDKAKYVNVFMNHLVSWDAALGRMARAQAFVNLGEPKIPVA